MNFLDLVLESTKEYEAPKRFYYWAALSAISAVLKDHVWFDMGGQYKVYPNIYVLLYGPSGVRKGPAINLAEQVVRRVNNTRVISGRSSLEGIIKELGTFETKPGVKAEKDSAGFVVASELSSSIISNTQAMDTMTALFDRIYTEGEWKYRLKEAQSIFLNKPTITWLAGTNEALFREFIPEKNIHGGLIGRMYMIVENKPERLNSLMWKPKKVPDFEEMAEELRPLNALRGEFEMSESNRTALDQWYMHFMTEKSPELKDETGFVSRIEDFIIKNAMIISSGRRGDKIITTDDLMESIAVTQPLISPTKKVSIKAKKTEASWPEKRALILEYLCNHGFEADRKEILKNLNMKIDHEDLDRVVNHMLQAETIEIGNRGGDVHYSLNIKNPKVASWIEMFRS